ncbi:MAG: type III pantothenate kinase [Acidobacteriota bacterium]
MLLVIDVGNTNTVLGIFSGEELISDWRLSTVKDRTIDEYGILTRNLISLAGIDASRVDAIAISSVVPTLNATLEEMSKIYFQIEPLFVEPGVKTGMPILYENPHDVGADRITNSVAAFTLYGGPAIVIDFGTATTFDVINEKGEYLGGVIAAGPQIAAEALFERTARLPRTSIKKPPKVIGKNTVHSIQSGIYHGYIVLVEGIVKEIREELGTQARVIATGGLSGTFSRDIKCIDDFNPHLTLLGLRIIYEKNRKS